ncbi:hypothetical protein ACFLZZ_03000 [Nanoarchaeota archaeon]
MRKIDYRIERIFAVFTIYLMFSLTIASAYAIAIPEEEIMSKQSPLASLSLFFIEVLDSMLPGVAADDDFCCERTTTGSYCIEMDRDASEDCDVPLTPGRCSADIDGCFIGTCIQQNGDCDAYMPQQKCEDSFGVWDSRPLLEIDACTPTCCIYTDDEKIVDTEHVAFRNKCERLPQFEEEELNLEERNVNPVTCRSLVDVETNGYCTFIDKAVCEFTTFGECNEDGGNWEGNKRCASCVPNFEIRCPSEKDPIEQGFGAYYFDSCGGPGDIYDACDIEEVCEADEGEIAHCEDKTCPLDIRFTNLGYDTEYFKANEVEIEGMFEGNYINTKVLAGTEEAINGYNLQHGEQACVRFQGPGEQHYMISCIFGEMQVFGVHDSRENICTFNGENANGADNRYETCQLSGQNKGVHEYGAGSFGKLLSKTFSFLGGDLLTPKFWDKWAFFAGPLGLSTEQRCKAEGVPQENRNAVIGGDEPEQYGGTHCIATKENNDCVPKYAPATNDYCNTCSTNEASNPWNKCGEETQCTSLGYCTQQENRANVLASATICLAETTAQTAILTGIRAIADNDKTRKYFEDARTKLRGDEESAEAAKKELSDTWADKAYRAIAGDTNKDDGKIAKSIPDFFRKLVTAPGTLVGGEIDNGKATTAANELGLFGTLVDRAITFTEIFFLGPPSIKASQKAAEKKLEEGKKTLDQLLKDADAKMKKLGADAKVVHSGEGAVEISAGERGYTVTTNGIFVGGAGHFEDGAIPPQYKGAFEAGQAYLAAQRILTTEAQRKALFGYFARQSAQTAADGEQQKLQNRATEMNKAGQGFEAPPTTQRPQQPAEQIDIDKIGSAEAAIKGFEGKIGELRTQIQQQEAAQQSLPANQRIDLSLTTEQINDIDNGVQDLIENIEKLKQDVAPSTVQQPPQNIDQYLTQTNEIDEGLKHLIENTEELTQNLEDAASAAESPPEAKVKLEPVTQTAANLEESLKALQGAGGVLGEAGASLGGTGRQPPQEGGQISLEPEESSGDEGGLKGLLRLLTGAGKDGGGEVTPPAGDNPPGEVKIDKPQAQTEPSLKKIGGRKLISNFFKIGNNKDVAAEFEFNTFNILAEEPETYTLTLSESGNLRYENTLTGASQELVAVDSFNDKLDNLLDKYNFLGDIKSAENFDTFYVRNADAIRENNAALELQLRSLAKDADKIANFGVGGYNYLSPSEIETYDTTTSQIIGKANNGMRVDLQSQGLNQKYLDNLPTVKVLRNVNKLNRKLSTGSPTAFSGQGAIPLTGSATAANTPAPGRVPTSLELGADQLAVQSSEYHGGLYHFPIRAQYEQKKSGYAETLKNYVKSQGSLGGFLARQFVSLGKSYLVGLILFVMLEEDAGLASFANPQYYIKAGVCFYLAPFVGSHKACMKAKWIVPGVVCTFQSAVNSEALSRNVCIPTPGEQMPGVVAGHQNCEKCHEDSYPCTAERCQTLSSDGSCVYDAYERQCFPDPEKVKECGSASKVEMLEINDEKIPSNNRFTVVNIPYEDASYEIEVKTDLAAECKYTINKTEGWENMKQLITDRSFVKHNVTLSVFDPERANFTYFVLCKRACKLPSWSETIELNLVKEEKPDLIGPIIISKNPEPDTPIEGGSHDERELLMWVETDENAVCRWKEWPLAAGIDSFIGEMERIEEIASNLLDTEASQQTLESELSLTGLSWDDPNLTDIEYEAGVSFAERHEVRFEGDNALNNSEIYAYVFLCQDEKGNLGEVPGIVRFKVSEEFEVEIKEPINKTVEGRPEIRVTTERSSSCRYSIENQAPFKEMSSFDQTGGTSHKTTTTKLLSFGDHRLIVSCLDEDGFNIASDESRFSVVKDSTSPKIVRAYKDAETLLVSTDELTSCQYDFKSFTYGGGKDMTGNNPVAITHRVEWRPKTTYFIVCRDRFGNLRSTSLKTTKSTSGAFSI